MTVPPKVVELVELFGSDLALYKRAGYKEAHVRIDFIDPFFEALGWDVRNVRGQREHSKDVIHEDAITVAGKTRAPDYSFRIGGARKFFLEAKKPSVSLKGDVGPAFQLRRYSWSVKLPLGILTDFEEFAVYDCRRCPRASDKASVGRLMYFTFDQYLDRFDEIHSMPKSRCGKAHLIIMRKPSKASVVSARWMPSFSKRSKAGATRWRATLPCATKTCRFTS